MLEVARLSAAVSQLRVSPRSARAGAAHHSRRVRTRRVRSAISTTNMTTTASWVDEGDFEALREAMTTYDEQRDTVIKRARDITKASKVAIYCLHRGEIDKADAQIATAAQVADELLPIVSANLPLRGGSYSGGLEEYAEAVVFDEDGNTIWSDRPDRNSEAIERLTEANGVDALLIPGEAFSRVGEGVGIGVVGFVRAERDDFDGFNLTWSDFGAGQFSAATVVVTE